MNTIERHQKELQTEQKMLPVRVSHFIITIILFYAAFLIFRYDSGLQNSEYGFRSERPEIAEQYCRQMPEFRLRLQVQAGLTGYAQVYGKYNTDPYEKLEFDLLYINHMSIVTDLKLLFSTIGILFSGESTNGVKGITANDTREEDI